MYNKWRCSIKAWLCFLLLLSSVRDFAPFQNRTQLMIRLIVSYALPRLTCRLSCALQIPSGACGSFRFKHRFLSSLAQRGLNERTFLWTTNQRRSTSPACLSCFAFCCVLVALTTVDDDKNQNWIMYHSGREMRTEQIQSFLLVKCQFVLLTRW